MDPITIKDYIKWENGSSSDGSKKHFRGKFQTFLRQLYKFINKLSEQKQLINTTGSGLYSKRIKN